MIFHLFSSFSCIYNRRNIDIGMIFNKLIDHAINKEAGPDNLLLVFMDNCTPILALAIPIIITDKYIFYFLETSKIGNRTDTYNYHPVSGLSCLSKLLESLVYDVLFASFENVISAKHHGFYPGKSCQTNLSIYTNSMVTP